MVQIATSVNSGVEVKDNSVVVLNRDSDNDGVNDILDPKLLYPPSSKEFKFANEHI